MKPLLCLQFNEDECLFRAFPANEISERSSDGWKTIKIAPFGDWAKTFTDFMQIKYDSGFNEKTKARNPRKKFTLRTTIYDFLEWSKTNMK